MRAGPKRFLPVVLVVVIALALAIVRIPRHAEAIVRCDGAGNVMPAVPPSRLNHPSEIAVLPGGKIYVLDTDNQRLVEMDAAGVVSTVAGTGSAGCSGDNGPATSAQLNGPDGLAVAPDGTIYIADTQNRRIRAVRPNGIIVTVAGGARTAYTGDGGPATHAGISRAVEGLTVGPEGSLYITDTLNHRIRRVDGVGTIRTVAGRGKQGFSGDGGRATEADINTPEAIAVAPDGTMYVADSGNNRLRVVRPDGVIQTLAGDGTGGCDRQGDRRPAQLACPQGLALDASGSLYIADSLNNRVRRLTPDGTIVTIAGTGTAGYSGDGGLATAAELSVPQGLALATDGSLYIVDRGNHVIRRVTPDGLVTTVLR